MGNPYIAVVRTHLELADQSITDAGDRVHTARADIHAQLAIAHELNTIARLLAYTAEVITPADSALLSTPAAVVQHNAIIERLGL